MHSFPTTKSINQNLHGSASTLQSSSKESNENLSKNLLIDQGNATIEAPQKSKSILDPIVKVEDLVNSGAKNILVTKTIYNNASDSLYKTQNNRNGFINHDKGMLLMNKNRTLFGVYCVIWRRADSHRINESKFIINGVGKES